jgi:WD40 repeat protein
MMQNGVYFISGGDDSKIKVWNSTSFSLVAIIGVHTGNVNVLQTLSNGLVVSGSSDNTVKVWNQLGTVQASFNPFGNAISCLKEISTGVIAVGGNTQSVYIYYTNGTLIRTLSGILNSQCNGMAMFNQTILAIAQSSRILALFDVSLVSAPLSLTSINGDYNSIYSLESLRMFSVHFDLYI